MKIHKCKNGATILFLNKNIRTTRLCFCIKAGSVYENRSNNGVSHLIEHLICKSSELQKIFHQNGGILEGSTYKEYTLYDTVFISANLKKIFPAALKAIITARFNKKELMKEKKITKEEINARFQNYDTTADDLFQEEIYKGHPYSLSSGGSVKAFSKIYLSELEKYYDAFYQPRNLVVCYLGNINKESERVIIENCEKLDNKNFDKLPEIPNFIPSNTKNHLIVKKVPTDQLTVNLSFLSYNSIESKSYLSALLSSLLTGGYASLLFKTLREEKNLIYDIESSFSEFSGSGYFTINLSAGKKNIIKTYNVIAKTLKHIKENLVSDDQLRIIKNAYVNQILIYLENIDNTPKYYASEYIIKKTFVDIEKEIIPLVKKLSANDIKNSARKIFKFDLMRSIIIGNLSRKKKNEIEKILSQIKN